MQLLHHLTEHSEVGGHLQGKFPHGKAPGQHLPPLQTAGQRMACHLITGEPVLLFLEELHAAEEAGVSEVLGASHH